MKLNNKIELMPSGGEGDRSNLIMTEKQEKQEKEERQREKGKKKRSTLTVVNKNCCEIKDTKGERNGDQWKAE